jgi:hypothetical protein
MMRATIGPIEQSGLSVEIGSNGVREGWDEINIFRTLANVLKIRDFLWRCKVEIECF